MSQIRVDPGALQAGGGAIAASGSQVTAVRGELGAAVGAAGAFGDPTAAGAYLALCGAWSQALTALDERVEGLGRLAQSAAHAYTTTDTSVIPGSGP